MSWIKKLFFKALDNSSLHNIQMQFLGILVVITLSILGYQFYKENWTLNFTVISVLVCVLIFGILYKKPIVLKPLLLIWLLFGLLLGEITSTIILAFIFYFLFFPITFVLRIINRKKQTTYPQWFLKEKDQIDYNKLY